MGQEQRVTGDANLAAESPLGRDPCWLWGFIVGEYLISAVWGGAFLWTGLTTGNKLILALSHAIGLSAPFLVLDYILFNDLVVGSALLAVSAIYCWRRVNRTGLFEFETLRIHMPDSRVAYHLSVFHLVGNQRLLVLRKDGQERTFEFVRLDEGFLDLLIVALNETSITLGFERLSVPWPWRVLTWCLWRIPECCCFNFETGQIECTHAACLNPLYPEISPTKRKWLSIRQL